jgi:hypothetical protein
MCEARYDRRSSLHRSTATRDPRPGAYANVTPASQPAVRFYSSFRDLTATGFWTTRSGIADLEYKGNTFVDEWNGCPENALKKLGVSYE